MDLSEKRSSVQYKIRPRFKVETSLSIDTLIAGLKAALANDNASCQGRVYATSARLFLPYEDQHYWSPELSLTFEPTENGTILRGLYGPRAGVWTMFVFFYAIIGLGLLIISIVGLSYLSLGKPAVILWWVPLLLAVFLTLYLVAYFGQKLGSNQMGILQKFLEESTGLSFDKE